MIASIFREQSDALVYFESKMNSESKIISGVF